MPIAFRCPNCQTTFQADDADAGQIHACTSCGAQLRVPAPAASPLPSPKEVSAPNGAFAGGASANPSDEQAWHTPYASPQADPHPVMQTRQPGYFFRAANGLVGTLTVLFVLNAMFDFLFVFLEAAMLTVDVSMFGILELGNGTVLTYFDAFYTLCGIAMAIVYLTTAVIYLVWVNRANKNARALGAVGMKFTPGWCVGWWFIPIANLFKPFQAVREIYLASSPTASPTTWRVSPAPSLLGLWWAAWIAGNILANIEGRLAMSGEADLIEASSAIGIVSSLIGIAAAITAMQVVRQINARQNQKAERTSKPQEPAFAG